MQQGKIVYQGKSKSGKEIIFRYPTKDDLKSLWEYINKISREKTFISFQGEEITLEGEQKWLETELQKITDGEAVQVLVFSDNKLIGVSGISMKERAEKHVGIFGITIAKDFRKDGIGVLLAETVLKETKKNLKELKIVTLGVFGNNPVAQKLYKKMGFVEYGNLPKGAIHRGVPVDHIYMYKEIFR